MTETTPRTVEFEAYIRDNRPALDDQFALEVLNRGLPHLIFALDAIIDSIDNRLGDIERRLDAAGIPRPDGEVPGGQEWRYYAFYTLTGDADYGKWEQFRRDSAP